MGTIMEDMEDSKTDSASMKNTIAKKRMHRVLHRVSILTNPEPAPLNP